MSSNPPPPISTPNANMNADFTPPDDNLAPPRVNVVTQASQLTQEFNLVSTPAQQRNRNNLREEFLDFQEEEILEHANTETMPRIVEPLSSTVPHFPTPATNHSSDTSNKHIHSMIETTTMKNIDRAAAARSMVPLSNSTGKKRYTPKTSLLTFLHSEDIVNQLPYWRL